MHSLNLLNGKNVQLCLYMNVPYIIGNYVGMYIEDIYVVSDMHAKLFDNWTQNRKWINNSIKTLICDS